MTGDIVAFNRRSQEVAVELRNGAHWQEFAVCRVEEPEYFGPKVRGEKKARYAERLIQLGAMCGRCVVENKCDIYKYKIKDFVNYGAGMTGDERRSQFNKQQAVTAQLNLES